MVLAVPALGAALAVDRVQDGLIAVSELADYGASYIGTRHLNLIIYKSGISDAESGAVPSGCALDLLCAP